MIAADVDMLDDLLHDNLVFGHTNGHADDKNAYLEKLRMGAVRYHDAHHQIEGAKVLGDTALVKSHLKIQVELPNGTKLLNVVALTVWTLTVGRWRMVAHHPTVVDF